MCIYMSLVNINRASIRKKAEQQCELGVKSKWSFKRSERHGMCDNRDEVLSW